MNKTELELLSEICIKLDNLTTVLVTQGRTQDEQIQILRNLGFDWSYIASVTGLKAEAARKHYSRIKK